MHDIYLYEDANLDHLLSMHRFLFRTTVTFCCQFIEEKGYPINRKLFEDHAEYLRTALVAYNAVYKDTDLSKKEYLHNIVHDALFGEKY